MKKKKKKKKKSNNNNKRKKEKAHFIDTGFNPITAPACKMSGLKSAQTLLLKEYFLVYNKSNFNIVRFDEHPFTY